MIASAQYKIIPLKKYTHDTQVWCKKKKSHIHFMLIQHVNSYDRVMTKQLVNVVKTKPHYRSSISQL